MYRRLILVAALLAGISFAFVPRAPDDAWWVAWKALGVALLALWAAFHARDGNGWLLVGVLAVGALGDVLLEILGMAIGGAAFLVGHLIAITLYLANRRGTRRSAIATALAGAAIVSDSAFAMTRDSGVALYASGLGGMAGSAIASRFPIAAFGAVSFVLSDLMIFAALGPLAHSTLPGLVIWPTYLVGQVLVAIGVVHGLRRRGGGTISAI
jgi:uncharacterized membrane protein YhhN